MIAPDAPTLTLKTSPGKGVEVYIPSIDADAITATATRVADGVIEEVRGAVRKTVSGDFLITDWAVPFGVESTYSVRIFDAGGASVSSGQSSITVDSEDVVFMNPIDPSEQFTVTLSMLASSSFGSISATRDTRSVYVGGLKRPFIQDWGLKGLESLPLGVDTDTAVAALALKNLLDASQILIRTPPVPFSVLPRLLYASVARPTVTPQTWISGGESVRWTLTVDEAQPVAQSIIRPLVTWQDWMDAYPTEKAAWTGTAGASTSTTPAITGDSVTNLVTNPSGETASTGWSVVAGTSGVAAVTNPRVIGALIQGARELQAKWSTASTAAGGGITFDVPVSAGTVYSFGFGRVRSSIGNRLQMSVEWRTASTTVSTVTGTAKQVTAGTIYDQTDFALENKTAPATATIARVSILSVAGTGYANWAIGSYLGVKLLTCNTGATAYRPFDGDTVFGSTWGDVMADYGAGTWTDALRNPPNA